MSGTSNIAKFSMSLSSNLWVRWHVGDACMTTSPVQWCSTRESKSVPRIYTSENVQTGVRLARI